MTKYLLTAALLGVALLAPSSAQASVRCSNGAKTMTPDQCAFWNMAQAAPHFYALPSFKSFYVGQTAVGKFHSVWTGYINYPGKAIRFTLTARRCGNTYVVYSHRQGVWWPRSC